MTKLPFLKVHSKKAAFLSEVIFQTGRFLSRLLSEWLRVLLSLPLDGDFECLIFMEIALLDAPSLCELSQWCDNFGAPGRGDYEASSCTSDSFTIVLSG